MKNHLKDLLRPVKFIFDYLSLCIYLLRVIRKENGDVNFRLREIKVIRLLINKLANKSERIIKTTEDSKAVYDQYDDRDLRDERINQPELMLVGGKVLNVGLKDRRINHLQYLFTEIDRLLEIQDRVKILEVGCGNLANAYETKKKYNDRVYYGGIEISRERISIGLSAFPELARDNFTTQSITERTNFSDGEFDIVFSMHCLEQIAYDTKNAISEMHRISNKLIVMIEPVFENGNFLQRSYLMLSDHTRILLQTIYSLNLKLTRNEICNMQTNLENQSTLLVISKK